ncbi:unnamed protein product, partial [Mesorhabditis spiculigera]
MGSQRSIDPLNDPTLQQLFRVFSYFADLCPSGTLSPAQAYFILSELQRACDRPTTSQQFYFDSDCINFRELLTFIETLFLANGELELAVQRLYERLIAQIIRKDFILYRKRGGTCSLIKKHQGWKAAWITVAPGVINLWPVHKPNCRKEFTLDKAATAIAGPKENGRHILYVSSSKEKYTFAHFDEIARNALAKDIKLAISYRTKFELNDHDHRIANRGFGVKRKDREASWRLALEAENGRLLQVIEEGKRSLRDEEIVRALATRLLKEEREKNERLVEIVEQLGQQMRLSCQPECTTVTVNLQRNAEEGRDSVQVIEREIPGSVDDSESPLPSLFESEAEQTPYDEADEPSAVERARRERELYLISSTQSI